jgi:predicted phosphoribosyltransferase
VAADDGDLAEAGVRVARLDAQRDDRRLVRVPVRAREVGRVVAEAVDDLACISRPFSSRLTTVQTSF